MRVGRADDSVGLMVSIGQRHAMHGSFSVKLTDSRTG
jgi:hypothetical protein